MNRIKKSALALSLGAAVLMGGMQDKKDEAPKKDEKQESFTVPGPFAHDWVNSDKPLTIADLKGKIVLIKFFHYN